MIPVNWEMLHMIDELDGKAVKKTSNIIFCKRHLTEAIKYLCTTCNVWVCDKCKVTDHQKSDCNILGTKEAVKKEKKALKSDLKEEKDSLEIKVNKLNEELEKLSERQEVIDIFLTELVERKTLFENLEEDVATILNELQDSLNTVLDELAMKFAKRLEYFFWNSREKKFTGKYLRLSF